MMLLGVGLTVGGIASPAIATQESPVKKVTLCHARPPDTNKNGWIEITVGVAAAIGPKGHDHHAMDIIPPFTYQDKSGIHQFKGLNWDAKGQAVFNNGCKPVKPSPTPTKSKSVSPTPSKSESVSPTPSKSESVSPTPSKSESVSPTPSKSESVSPTPSKSKSPTPSVAPSVAPSPSQSPAPTGMPVTGWPGGLLLAAGVALLLAGGVLLLIGRLRKITAE